VLGLCTQLFLATSSLVSPAPSMSRLMHPEYAHPDRAVQARFDPYARPQAGRGPMEEDRRPRYVVQLGVVQLILQPPAGQVELLMLHLHIRPRKMWGAGCGPPMGHLPLRWCLTCIVGLLKVGQKAFAASAWAGGAV
jgi:hypothetical protein